METIKIKSMKMESNIEKLEKSSKEIEEVKTEQFETISLGDLDEKYEPFNLVGKKGKYTLVLGNTAVWEKEVKSTEEAKELLEQKPWKLTLIATKVYSEYVNEYIKKQK